jgi:beta-glucosidase
MLATKGPRYQGAGSSLINPTRLGNALDAIRAPASGKVTFAPVFTVDGAADADLVAEAVAAAASAVVARCGSGVGDSRAC